MSSDEINTPSEFCNAISNESRIPIYDHVYSDNSDTSDHEQITNVECKRGRKSTIDVKQLHNLLEKNQKYIFKDGKITTPSQNAIFTKIANEFDNFNKNSVFQAAKRYFNANQPKIPHQVQESPDFIQILNKNNNKNNKSIEHVVDITNLNIFRNKKNQIVPSRKWSPLVRQFVFVLYNVPCAWSFDRHRMAANEFSVNGHCLECDAALFLHTSENHKKLTIRIIPSKNIVKHNKKSSVRVCGKEEISEMLKEHSAHAVLSKLANNYLRLNDETEPAHLPTGNTLRRSKNNNEKSLYFDDDVMKSLWHMKYNEQYTTCIKSISMDPFEVAFSTSYQRELTRLESNRRKIVLSFDATGVKVHPPKTSSYSMTRDKFKPIFLYVVMLQCNGRNFPVYQFITQRQDSENIAFLMTSWKIEQLGRTKHVSEVVTDAGNAVILASVLAFTKFSTVNEYSDACFRSLKSGQQPPETYIRLDRAHIIKSFLTATKDLDKNKYRLYTRTFGVLLLSSDINVSENIIRNLFIVLLNRFQHSQSVVDAISDLKSLIDTHDIRDAFSANHPNCDNEIDDKASIIWQKSDEKKSLFSNFIYDIVENVKEVHVNSSLNDSTDEIPLHVVENPFYAPKKEKTFMKFFSKLHLWSNVMNETFASNNLVASSACNESDFKRTKHFVFPKKTVRADFLCERILIIWKALHSKTSSIRNSHERSSVQQASMAKKML